MTARSWIGIVVAAALLAVLPAFFGESASTMGILVEGLTFACYAVAFNIIFGSSGQLFLCVGALAGLGGFGTAILADRYGLPVIVALAIGVVVASAVASLLGWIAVKRSLGTIFVGVVTLAFSLGFHNLVLGLRDYTGGESGMRVVAGSGTFLREKVPPYYLFLAVLVVFLVLYTVIDRSRMGWAFRALRDDEVAAELSGIDVARYRVTAVAIGAAMLGLVGGLAAISGSGFIGPTTFDFADVTVPVIVMLSLGGIGSRMGPVVGAAILTALDDLLSANAQLRLILYGVILVVLFLGFAQGLVPAVTNAARRLVNRPATT